MLSNYSKLWLELAVVAGVFIVISFGEWLGLVQPVTSVFEHLSQPAVVKVSQVTASLGQPFLLIGSSFSSARRIQDLEQKYSQSLARISELEYLEQENKELRQLLQAQEKQTPVVIAAPIISRGQPSISLGKVADIKVGQPVLVADILVGLVEFTSDHQSVVSLLTQNNTSPILVKTESGVSGLVVGNGKDIIFTEIPKEAQVSVGELVVTVGQEQIPSQLVIGKIQQLVDQPSAPIKEAIIRQGVSFYEASIVEVIQ